MSVPGVTNLVDAVQQRIVQHDVGRRQLRLELLNGSRADDRRGYRRVVEHESDRHLDQGKARFLSKLTERLRCVQADLALMDEISQRG